MSRSDCCGWYGTASCTFKRGFTTALSLTCEITADSCKLDMVLYSEEVRSAVQSALYPVNSLRNAALAQAKTEVPAPSEHHRTADTRLQAAQHHI